VWLGVTSTTHMPATYLKMGCGGGNTRIERMGPSRRCRLKNVTEL
jgi:hypothetical protein